MSPLVGARLPWSRTARRCLGATAFSEQTFGGDFCFTHWSVHSLVIACIVLNCTVTIAVLTTSSSALIVCNSGTQLDCPFDRKCQFIFVTCSHRRIKGRGDYVGDFAAVDICRRWPGKCRFVQKRIDWRQWHRLHVNHADPIDQRSATTRVQEEAQGQPYSNHVHSTLFALHGQGSVLHSR